MPPIEALALAFEMDRVFLQSTAIFLISPSLYPAKIPKNMALLDMETEEFGEK